MSEELQKMLDACARMGISPPDSFYGPVPSKDEDLYNWRRRAERAESLALKIIDDLKDIEKVICTNGYSEPLSTIDEIAGILNRHRDEK